MNLTTALRSLALAAGLAAAACSQTPPPAAPATTPAAEAAEAADAHAPHEELAVTMAYFQRYAEKLHFALEYNNDPLAAFYLHELEESADALAQAGMVDEGMPVSQLTEQMLLPAVARLEKTLKSGDRPRLAEHYDALLNACNTCHKATAHDFIVITRPDQPTYRNQDFRPAGKR